MAGGARAADPATKSRFVAAAKSTGCESIPYPDLFAACKDLHDNKQKPACKKERKCAFSETTAERQVIQNKVEAKKATKKVVATAKQDKTDRLAKADDKEKEKLRAQIAEDDQTLRQIDEDIFLIKRSIIDVFAERRANGQACMDARDEVIGVFRTSRGTLNTESDPDLDTLVKQIVALHDASIAAHEKTVTEVVGNLDKCRREMNEAMSDLDAYLARKK